MCSNMSAFVIEKRYKFAPAVIQKGDCKFSVKVLNRDVKVRTSRPDICEKVTTEYRIDYNEASPKKYISTCTISTIPVPVDDQERQIVNNNYIEQFRYEGATDFRNYSEQMSTAAINAKKIFITEMLVETDEPTFEDSFEYSEMTDRCRQTTGFKSPRTKLDRICLFEDVHSQTACSP